MARERKIKAIVINIALSRQKNKIPGAEDYRKLLIDTFKTRKQIRIHGDKFAFMQQLYKQPKNGFISGVLGTYTKIDVSDDWLNTETGEKATEKDLNSVSIPGNLLPHYRKYNFYFELNKHKLILEYESEPSFGEKRSPFSPKLSKNYFQGIFLEPSICNEYGEIGVTVFPESNSVEELISWKKIERITLKLRPPNPDDDDLEEQIERRMNGMHVARYDETLRATRGAKLNPDEELKAMMRIASRNGYVVAEGREGERKVERSTKDKPYIADVTYNEGRQDHLSAFAMLANKVMDEINGDN